MRKFSSIVRATALEILSEPLSLLVLLAALVIAVLAPAFHYHQFGEATRMARDAGFSALLVCGGVLAAFGTLRAFRREIESGTLEMALAHPVSRRGFFLAKTAGAAVAYLVFAAIVLSVSLTIVEGAAVGGRLASASGDIARLWGPCLAAGLGVTVVPLVLGAVLNRFANCRFVLSAFALAALGAAGCAAWTAFRDGLLVLRLLPVALLIVLLSLVIVAAAAAFSVRFPAASSASAVGVVAVLLLPAVGNYCLSDALSGGGTVPWSYVGLAALATAPAVLLFLLLGVFLMDRHDLS